MNAILTRYKIGGAVTAALELAVVKTHLRIDHADEDVQIAALIASAKSLADEYVNNPFTDALGVNTVIPDLIGEWLLAHTARAYERRAEGLDSSGIGGLTGSVKWSAEIDYCLLERVRLIPGI